MENGQQKNVNMHFSSNSHQKAWQNTQLCKDRLGNNKTIKYNKIYYYRHYVAEFMRSSKAFLQHQKFSVRWQNSTQQHFALVAEKAAQNSLAWIVVGGTRVAGSYRLPIQSEHNFSASNFSYGNGKGIALCPTKQKMYV